MMHIWKKPPGFQRPHPRHLTLLQAVCQPVSCNSQGSSDTVEITVLWASAGILSTASFKIFRVILETSALSFLDLSPEAGIGVTVIPGECSGLCAALAMTVPGDC